MNEQLTKQLGDYRRSLEDRKIQSTIYTIFILITIFLFDAYGIYTLVKVTKNRHEVLQKLEKLNSDLVYKKDQIDVLRIKLDESRYYLDMLETVVPKNPLVEDYMVDLVNTAAKHGYKQEKLQRRNKDDNYVQLIVLFQGQRDQFVPFIESLEERDRLAVIDAIYYSDEENAVKLQLVINIYYLER